MRIEIMSRRRSTPVTHPAAAITSLQLVGGQELTVENQGARNLIHLRSAGGRVALTIEVTADGPVLRFDGPGLTIQTTGPLAIESESIALHGRRGVSVSSGGDAAICVAGDLEISARAQRIRADLGNVEVHANDDVRVVGERVLLNC
jgi:hypothetical protein